MAIKRPTRAEIQRTLTEGTPKERIHLYDKHMTLISEGEKPLLSKADIRLIGKYSSEFEKAEYDFYEIHYSNMMKRKAAALLYDSELDYLSTLVNTHLKEIDIYTYNAYFLNDILENLKKEYSLEQIEEALQGKSELSSPLAQNLLRQIANYRSIDKQLLTIGYSYSKHMFIVDCTPLEAKLTEALETVENTLLQAKILYTMLMDYAEEYKVKDIIPQSLLSVFKNMQKEYAVNKRFSRSYYESLLQSKELEDIIQACKMEDNRDILFLFPNWKDVELPEDYKDYRNLFENG